MQIDLYFGFQDATGKTKALFGIKHLIHQLKPYIIVFGLIGFMLSIASIFFKEKLKMILLTMSLTVLVYFVISLQMWYWFS